MGNQIQLALALQIQPQMILLSQATAATKRLQEIENSQEKAVKDAKAQAAKSKQEAEQLTEQLRGVEAQMAELRIDHTAEAAGFAGAKRELEVALPPPTPHPHTQFCGGSVPDCPTENASTGSASGK